MSDHSRIYIGAAFVAGILLTLGLRDLYPELKQRLHRQRIRKDRDQSTAAPDALVARSGPPTIVDGVEGCIGNTPLLRIKSLSEATGCEILAKAEVCFCLIVGDVENCLLTFDTVLKWSRPEL